MYRLSKFFFIWLISIFTLLPVFLYNIYLQYQSVFNVCEHFPILRGHKLAFFQLSFLISLLSPTDSESFSFPHLSSSHSNTCLGSLYFSICCMCPCMFLSHSQQYFLYCIYFSGPSGSASKALGYGLDSPCLIPGSSGVQIFNLKSIHHHVQIGPEVYSITFTMNTRSFLG